jgi:hypothetical protein
MGSSNGLTLGVEELQTATPLTVYLNHEQRIRNNAAEIAATNATLASLSQKLDAILAFVLVQVIALVGTLGSIVVRLLTNGGHL